MDVIIHRSVPRPWGIETFVTVAGTGREYSFCIVTSKKENSGFIQDKAIQLFDRQIGQPSDSGKSERIAELKAQKAEIEFELALLEAKL